MIKNSLKRVLKADCAPILGRFLLLILTVSMLAGFSFKKSEKTRSGTTIVETPQYRILFSFDTAAAKRGETAGSRMIELSYKYADLEEPPGQRFASSGGGKVRFLDKDGFAMGIDTFSIKDMESGDVYGFIWIDEKRARQIVGADAVVLRPEELQQLTRQEAGYHPKLFKAAVNSQPERVEEVVEQEMLQKDIAEKKSEIELVQEKVEKSASPVENKSAEEPKAEIRSEIKGETALPVESSSPSPSLEITPIPSPSESPEVEAPLFPPAPSNPAPEAPVFQKDGDSTAVVSPSPVPEASLSPNPSPAASVSPSPSPSPEPSVRIEPEVFEHAGVKNEDIQKTLAAQQTGPQTTIPPSQTKVDLPVIEQTLETSPQVKADPAPPPAPEAKEQEKDGVIFKQTFL